MTIATSAPLPDPHEEPARHLDVRRRLFELHPNPTTRADLADALAFDATYVVRSVWRHAHQVDIVLRDGGRFGPRPVFAELRSQSAALVAPAQLRYLWPEDGRALAAALQSLYAAVELAGRDGDGPESWAGRFAAASSAPAAAGRPWDIAAVADRPSRYTVTLPPPRRAAAPGQAPGGTSRAPFPGTCPGTVPGRSSRCRPQPSSWTGSASG
ncbi:hypothetical protein GCM10010441_29580 [Kitasatospora paracochleata]|uniref:Uncharacterized protein n=1 Tax=Kitasatospora paracochleata TaxID=58354 RepID=A0ABT1J9Y3_9ACTN|nr:hypothetical protein [Kitasatospora paracochleata]MCP2313919.1 hypothetical protein [Kitasatospora paracochleata]